MGTLDYLKIAKEYSLKKWDFDIVKDAGVLTRHIEDRETFMKGIDYSYYYEQND